MLININSSEDEHIIQIFGNIANFVNQFIVLFKCY